MSSSRTLNISSFDKVAPSSFTQIDSTRTATFPTAWKCSNSPIIYFLVKGKWWISNKNHRSPVSLTLQKVQSRIFSWNSQVLRDCPWCEHEIGLIGFPCIVESLWIRCRFWIIQRLHIISFGSKIYITYKVTEQYPGKAVVVNLSFAPKTFASTHRLAILWNPRPGHLTASLLK